MYHFRKSAGGGGGVRLRHMAAATYLAEAIAPFRVCRAVVTDAPWMSVSYIIDCLLSEADFEACDVLKGGEEKTHHSKAVHGDVDGYATV